MPMKVRVGNEGNTSIMDRLWPAVTCCWEKREWPKDMETGKAISEKSSAVRDVILSK
jgi:hypothetical protein